MYHSKKIFRMHPVHLAETVIEGRESANQVCPWNITDLPYKCMDNSITCITVKIFTIA